ncbi:hypothetical protein PV390_29170 [Streptomyces sp. ME02-6991-2A]|uniref:hypothetical protein n=1 Tax=Streptomyces sp. ME02-6991-2A TaxID=3028677 RepID=UPI0029A42BBA|nr:hypothetical protein [Streptomyces sp. ME02-6991-2A]MDX3378472.1 hypothetical protein [Streptomyces sp. ME02-6991-2A]
MIAASGGSPEAALAAYPDYVSLVDRLDRYLTAIPGEHRRSLAATALARACMQTPVIGQMASAWPQALTPGELREIDVPDGRLRTLYRDPAGLPVDVVTAADAAVVAEFGPQPLSADLPGAGAAALDDRFDEAWARWEDTVFAGLTARLTEAGATVLGSHGHLPAASELVARVTAAVPGLRLTVDVDPDPPAMRMVAQVLRQARLWLTTEPRPARLITFGQDVDPEEVVRVVDATTRVAGRPNVVLGARLPTRLLAGYAFPQSDRARLAGLDGPLLAIRTLADDGTDRETDAVWHVRLSDPADVAELTTAWAGGVDVTCCVAASCLSDERWRTRWLPVLQETAPVIWLIDVPVASLAGEFTGGRTVHGIHLDLGANPTGARRAVALKVSGYAGAWLAVADDVGIQLLTGQLADLPGIDLRMTGADWTAAVPALRLVLLDLLRTESYVDLRALVDRGN